MPINGTDIFTFKVNDGIADSNILQSTDMDNTNLLCSIITNGMATIRTK